MSRFKISVALVVVTILGVVSGVYGSYEYVANAAAAEKATELAAQVKVQKAKSEEVQALGQLIINMMYKSPKTIKELSPARKLIIAQSIVRVANDILDTEAQKWAFVGALQIESRFLKFAQSPTGPKGLGQVARATFHQALKACGVAEVNDDDVWETDLNLYASACYFKQQLNNSEAEVKRLHPGLDPVKLEKLSISGAIVAYNQGPEDEDSKRYVKDGVLKKSEPLAYLNQLNFNTNSTTDQKMPGVPYITDLPRPDKTKIVKTASIKNK